ncbi:MAG: hypothetical protein HOV92_18070 [Streptomyces sp.]|nr:hypothetical protein [Streptomyces sp.]
MNYRHLAAAAVGGVIADTAGSAASLACDTTAARITAWAVVASAVAIALGAAYGRGIPLATIVRAAITYPAAGLAAAFTAMVATVPLGPQPPAVLTAVWIAAAVTVGWPSVLLCDRITFHRTTSNGDRT